MQSNPGDNLSPACIRRIMKEIAELVQKPPEGIKVFQNEENISDVEAVIEGPAGTPYYGGYFRVQLKLGPDFPNSPPKGYFLTKIFHPNVSAKGEICVNTLKKDWKSELGIKHILLTIKCLLIVPNPESALNEEAGKLLLECYEDYAKHAALMTSIHAKAPIYSPPSTQSTLEESSSVVSSSSSDSGNGNTRIAVHSLELTAGRKTTNKEVTSLANTTTTTTNNNNNTNNTKPKTDKKKSLKRL